MKIKRQIPILIVSLWGVIELPLFYLVDITEGDPEPFIHTALQFFTVGTHLLWFAPAAWIAHLLGFSKQLYEVEILVFVRNPIGWILPVIVWFLFLNGVVWFVRKVIQIHSNKRIHSTP